MASAKLKRPESTVLYSTYHRELNERRKIEERLVERANELLNDLRREQRRADNLREDRDAKANEGRQAIAKVDELQLEVAMLKQHVAERDQAIIAQGKLLKTADERILDLVDTVANVAEVAASAMYIAASARRKEMGDG